MVAWGLKFRTQQPIGLDIGHNSIKMIQLDIHDEQISIIAADETRIDAGINGDEQSRRIFIISAINRMLASGSFQGRNVVSCLPSDKLKITSLRLAETEGYDIEQALRKEVAHRFELDPD
jgi:Tfp pilus assembly PilM family ATPase